MTDNIEQPEAVTPAVTEKDLPNSVSPEEGVDTEDVAAVVAAGYENPNDFENLDDVDSTEVEVDDEVAEPVGDLPEDADDEDGN